MITTDASGPISLSVYNQADCDFLDDMLTEDDINDSARTFGAKTVQSASEELKKTVPNSTSFTGCIIPRPTESRKFEPKAGQKPKTKVEVEVLKVHVGETVHPRLQLAIGGFDADVRKQLVLTEVTADIHYIFHRLRRDVTSVLARSTSEKGTPEVIHPALAQTPLSDEFMALLPNDSARARLTAVRLNFIPDYHMPDDKARVEYKSKNGDQDYPFAPPYLEGTALENRVRAALQKEVVLRCMENVLMTAARYMEPKRIVPGENVKFNTTAPIGTGQIALGVTGLVHVASIQVNTPLPTGEIPVKCIEFWQVKGSVSLVGGIVDPGSRVASYFKHADKPIITDDFLASVNNMAAQASRAAGEDGEITNDPRGAPSFTVPLVPFRELLNSLFNKAGARCIMSLDKPELPSSATADEIAAADKEFEARISFEPKDARETKKRAIRLDTTGNVFSWSGGPVFTRLPGGGLRVDLRGLCVCKVTVGLYEQLSAGFALNKYSVSNWRDLAPRVLPYMKGILDMTVNVAETPGFRSRVTPGVKPLVSQFNDALNAEFTKYRTEVEGVYEFPGVDDKPTPVQTRVMKTVFNFQPVEALKTNTRSLLFEPKDIVAGVGIPISREAAKFILERQTGKQGLSDPPGGNVVTDLHNLSVRPTEGTAPDALGKLKDGWQFYYVGPIQSEYAKDGAKADPFLCRRLEAGEAGYKEDEDARGKKSANTNTKPSVYDFIFSPEYDALRKGSASARERVLKDVKGFDTLTVDADIDVSKITGIVYALRDVLTLQEKEAVVRRAFDSLRPMVAARIEHHAGKENPNGSGANGVPAIMATAEELKSADGEDDDDDDDDSNADAGTTNPKKRKAPEPAIVDADSESGEVAEEDDDENDKTPSKVPKRIASEEDSQWAE